MIKIKIQYKSRGSLVVTASGYGLFALTVIVLTAAATTSVYLLR